MKNTFEPPTIDDHYALTEYLAVGFNNELTSNVFLDPRETQVIRKGTIKTVEERFAVSEGMESDPLVQAEITLYPGKIEMMNMVVDVLNKTDDVWVYKRAMNKMKRLLNGRDATLLYPEEEANPDKLALGRD